MSEETVTTVAAVSPRRRWQFGRVELAADELALRAELGAAVYAVVESLPAPLRCGAAAFLDVEARGRGPDGLIRKFPPPLWAPLLAWRRGLAPELAAEATTGQALALLLHLLDDHLCDGQLRCAPALLQLRTHAWTRFAAAIARLGEGLAGADAFASRQIDRHFAAVDRARGPIALEAALVGARGEMATWLVVPGLCVWRTDGASLRDALVGALERLFVAWRIVDDLDDVGDDARRGAVNVALARLAQNDDCIATDRDGQCLDDRLARAGIPAMLARRAHHELACAAAEADAGGWPRLAAQLVALARPLMTE